MKHEATACFDPAQGVTYGEMLISNERLGIDVVDIQFASDEEGDVEDGFTSEHKFSEVKIFGVKFPLNFDNDESDCDEDWFLDLIADVVTSKINEVSGEYSASDMVSDDDDFDFNDMDSYGFGEPGRWSISSFGVERSDENDDEEDESEATVTVTGEFDLADFENSNIDFDGCFNFSVTIEAEFSKGELVRWSVEKVTTQTDESRDYTIRDDLRSKFADWIRSSDELDDLCDYIVKNEMKID